MTLPLLRGLALGCGLLTACRPGADAPDAALPRAESSSQIVIPNVAPDASARAPEPPAMSSSSPSPPDAPEVAELEDSALPTEGKVPEAFVPRGWQIESRASGLIDDDALPDLALTLIEALAPGVAPEDFSERHRALVVLVRTSQGWQRKALSTKLLQCTTCGGVFGGNVSPVEVKLDKRELVVQQEFGSREVTMQSLRFRYDAAEGRLSLRQLTTATRDRAVGDTNRVEVTWSGGRRVKKTFQGKIDVKTERLVGTESRAETPPWIEDVDAAGLE